MGRRRRAQPVGPGLGWQDLRTAGDCLALQADGLRLAPNQSATKLAHLLGQPAAAGIPPERLRFGTVDTWLAWHLTGGARHVTDLSNAGVTGLVLPDGSGWDDAVLDAAGASPARSCRRSSTRPATSVR